MNQNTEYQTPVISTFFEYLRREITKDELFSRLKETEQSVRKELNNDFLDLKFQFWGEPSLMTIRDIKIDLENPLSKHIIESRMREAAVGLNMKIIIN